MSTQIIPNDVYVSGVLRANSMVLPSNSVGSDQVTSASPIAASKLVHRITAIHAQNHGSAATTQRIPIHTAYGATGTLLQIQASVAVACVGAATITVNLYKNGTTVLSGTVDIDSGDAAYDKVLGTISSAGYVANDVFEVVITATAGGGTLGQGLCVMVTANEDAS